MRKFAFTLAAASLVTVGPAWADEPRVSGGTFISITDGTPHVCVNVGENLLSVMLLNAQVQRTESWWSNLFKETVALGAKFDIALVDSSGKKFDFPRAVRLAARKQQSGVALLPMRVPLMSKYNLQGADGKAYTSMTFDISFISVEEKSSEFKILNTLIEFSSTLPLPPNPYTQGVGYFGDFANKIVEQNVKDGSVTNPDAVFGGDLAADAAQASACPPSGLRSGVEAVLFDYQGSPPSGSNVIRAQTADSNCYWLQGERVAFAAKPSNGAACPAAAPASAKLLDNPLISFVVNAWPKSKTAAPPSAADLLARNPHLTSIISREKVAQMLNGDGLASDSLEIDIGKVVELSALAGRRDVSSAARRRSLLAQSSNQDLAALWAARRCAAAGLAPDQCE